jgi:hypothetical protein
VFHLRDPSPSLKLSDLRTHAKIQMLVPGANREDPAIISGFVKAALRFRFPHN